MLSKYIIPGQRMELQAVEKSYLGESSDKKVYISKVHDILSDEKLEVVMPMEQTKLILLPLDAEYELFFYTTSGLYQCFARVTDRYKSNNVYIVLFEVTTNLRKHQRRDYYRYSCMLDMFSRELSNKEEHEIGKDEFYLEEGLPLRQSIVVDISGGGIRFISKFSYPKNTLIYIVYSLKLEDKEKQYHLVGKVLSSRKLENRVDEFEHRIQYVDITKADREEIIRYIFGEERKNRQKAKG